MADSQWTTAGVTYQIDNKPPAESAVFDPAYTGSTTQGK